jgi:DHA1 family multidrug resistance protein-like MFS transporter
MQTGCGRPSTRCLIRLAQWQRNLIGVLIAAFVSILGFNVAFPFLPLYIQDLGVSDPGRAAFWSGLIGSVAGVLAALIAPVWGHMADRRGRKPMLVRATAGSAVGLVIMGLAPGLIILLVGRIAFGLMAGTVPAANPLIAANTPAEHVAGAMGMLQSSIYVANAVGPLVGGILASELGYRVTFMVTAALYVVSAVPVYFLVRERFTPPVEQTPLVSSLTSNFRMVFRRSDLLLPICAAFLAYSATSAILPVLPLYIDGLIGDGSTERATGLAIGLQGVAGTIAALSVGFATKRFGYARLLTWTPPLVIGVYLGLWLTHSYLILVALLMVAGLIQGLSVTSLTALIAIRAPREQAGATFGVVTSINSFAFSGAPFIAGVVASIFGLSAVFLFSALLAAGMFILCLRTAHGSMPAATKPVRASRQPQKSPSP